MSGKCTALKLDLERKLDYQQTVVRIRTSTSTWGLVPAALKIRFDDLWRANNPPGSPGQTPRYDSPTDPLNKAHAREHPEHIGHIVKVPVVGDEALLVKRQTGHDVELKVQW